MAAASGRYRSSFCKTGVNRWSEPLQFHSEVAHALGNL
jgi:hypothetical protein